MVTYIIEMGGHRAVAENMKNALKKAYSWADVGAKVWVIRSKKMIQLGETHKLGSYSDSRRKLKLTVFFKTDEYGINVVSVHKINSEGDMSNAINVYDSKMIDYFGHSHIGRTDKAFKDMSKNKKVQMALNEIYHRATRSY